MRRPMIARTAALVAVAALALTACGGGADPLAGGGSGSADTETLRVGSGNFTESQILASVYAQALQAKGIAVEVTPPIGSRETYYAGLQDGSIDLIPEYTGTLLQFLAPEAPETEPEAVYAALQKVLPPTLVVLDKSAAEDKDAVVLTRETATRLNARTIADLAPHCDQLAFGGPPEFQTRPDGIPGIAEAYGCTFKEYRSLDAGGPFTLGALLNGDVQAADIFTTDGAIAANDLVVLEDPKNNFAAQNVLPLINKAKATDEVKQVLNAISAKLTTADLLALNTEAASDAKPSVEAVAKGWLTRNGLI